jgi:spore maturation protein SpmA
MTWFFVIFFLSGICFAAGQGLLKTIADGSMQAAKDAVTLALGLIGVMALWLGLMRVLEAGGFLQVLARAIRPVMVRLFPEVPAEHPAMGAMILNISSNLLGLGNAATPFGLRAMAELNRLNPLPGTATNAMCLFLAINTAHLTLLPLGVIAVRAAAGSAEPAAIFLPTLLATMCSMSTGIGMALFLSSRDRAYEEEVSRAKGERQSGDATSAPAAEAQGVEDLSRFRVFPHIVERTIGWAALAVFAAFAIQGFILAPDKGSFLMNELFSFWLLPALMLLIICYGLINGVKVYEAVVDGAKQGFDTAVKIIPFLVAILVAVSLVRQSGVMGLFAQAIGPVTALVSMPPEAVPMAIVRPLSGTGAFGIMSSIVTAAPDSYPAFVVSVMNGSCDTTFYILAVYFGSVGITKYRHAILAGLSADIVGLAASSLLSPLFWNPH